MLSAGAITVLATSVSSAGAATARSRGAAVAVSPARGGPRTTFTVRFTAPRRSGATRPHFSDGAIVTYLVRAAGGRVGPRCESSALARPLATRAGERMTVRLRSSSGWCAGRWAGTVTEVVRPGCGPVSRAHARSSIMPVCPQESAALVASVPLGRFAFTVSR
jgi:hypothetical protein